MTKKAPLLTIRPDPDQPRSLLPVDLVGLFTNGLMTPQAIMTEWQKYPNSALAGIITLADSIGRHGQINPISVQPTESIPGVSYLIVTGERRWWAHVLLFSEGRDIYEGNTRTPADQIKISLVAAGVSIRAHQMIENVVREDINAVEKAHGMWALRYELSGKNFCEVLPTSAQEKYLVGWGEVEKSLGVSSRYRQYVTSVLKLTPDARRYVGEHGLSESTIRPITQKLHKYPDLQIKALRQLVAWQSDDAKHSLVKEVKQLANELIADLPQAGTTPRPSLLPLEVPAKKKESKVKVQATPAPASAPVQARAPVPSQPVIQPPVPAFPRGSERLDAEPEQKPLITTSQTLRNRPRRECLTNYDLDLAIRRLTEALDFATPKSIDSLTALQNKITQFLANAINQ